MLLKLLTINLHRASIMRKVAAFWCIHEYPNCIPLSSVILGHINSFIGSLLG